jgi:hypothetical protein
LNYIKYPFFQRSNFPRKSSMIGPVARVGNSFIFVHTKCGFWQTNGEWRMAELRHCRRINGPDYSEAPAECAPAPESGRVSGLLQGRL